MARRDKFKETLEFNASETRRFQIQESEDSFRELLAEHLRVPSDRQDLINLSHGLLELAKSIDRIIDYLQRKFTLILKHNGLAFWIYKNTLRENEIIMPDGLRLFESLQSDLKDGVLDDLFDGWPRGGEAKILGWIKHAYIEENLKHLFRYLLQSGVKFRELQIVKDSLEREFAIYIEFQPDKKTVDTTLKFVEKETKESQDGIESRPRPNKREVDKILKLVEKETKNSEDAS
ncbi:MAG: hypothetical protein HYW77_01450 [Parcubacteria group bacterium]|nr:hypothetical protein [Parcubacteria group bacterium]